MATRRLPGCTVITKVDNKAPPAAVTLMCALGPAASEPAAPGPAQVSGNGR
jgi:hypothetical protein